MCKNPICYFHSAHRFATRTLAHVLDSLVRVTRRVEKNHLASVLECQYYDSASFDSQQYKYSSKLSTGLCRIEKHPQTYIEINVDESTTIATGFRKCTSLFRKYPMHAGKTHEKHQKSQASGPTLPEVQRQTSTLSSNNLTRKNWFHSLPTHRFHALLTLFSKSFSPFHHCTCLLSVSDLYLALEGNYLPFCAPIPKYATLWIPTVRTRLSVKDGDFTLSVASFQ